MTQIRFSEKPRWRESSSHSRAANNVARKIVVALEPSALLLRLKGTRQILRLPLATAFTNAAFLEADAKRAQRKSNRRVRRGI